MKFNSKRVALLALAVSIAGMGCTGGSAPVASSDGISVGDGDGGTTPSSAVVLSGVLALQGSQSFAAQKSSFMTKSSFATLADAEDFRISCSTFEATPKSCGGPVASNGAFNVSCDGFAAIPFGCFVYNTATFNNYPITFNVNSTDEKSAMNVAATTITGIDLVIDTDTGTATAAATITNPDTIEKSWWMRMPSMASMVHGHFW